MKSFSDYKIAGSVCRINVIREQLAPMDNIKPFEYDGSEEPLFSLILDSFISKPNRLVYESDEYFFKMFEADGGYLIKFRESKAGQEYGMYFDTTYTKFLIDMPSGKVCTTVLNNMLMMAYTFATIGCGSLMIHSSVAVVNGKGYMFLGKSGTGKSTHCRLWLKNIEGADILNDDNPILKVEDDGVYVYGSAWSGKGCVYKNERYPVGAIVRLAQAPHNKIERKSGAAAFALLYTACSKLPWSSRFMEQICSIIGKIVAAIPVYFLECLPDDAAALLCYDSVK